MAPELPAQPLDEGTVACFHSFQVVLTHQIAFTGAAAWAAGVQAARAPVVVLCEDHSYPEPTWAEHLLAAHQGPWAVVGPAMRNGNPDTRVSWAEFFIDFGEWAYPSARGRRAHLPGHNSSYKREILLAYGDELARKLEAETLLHWELGRQGHQLFLEPDAVTKHINFFTLHKTIGLHFWQGWEFASQRTAAWSRRRRLLWVLGSPLIPVVRLRRVYGEIKRRRRHYERPLLGPLAIICLLLLVDSCGQAAGIAFGPGNVYRRLSRYEHFVELRANKPAI